MVRSLLPLLLPATLASDVDVDVVVIGGGAAGLAAIARLAAANVTSFALLEAANFTGGRVHARAFGHPSVRRGVVELGANWVHGASERNPLWPAARRAGLKVLHLPGSCANVSGYGLFEADGFPAEAGVERAAAANRAYDCLNATAQSIAEDESVASALSACGLEPSTALDRALRWELSSANDELAAGELSLRWTLPDPTYSQLGPDDEFVHDQRPEGYSRVLLELLKDAGLGVDDHRIRRNETVTRIDSSACDSVRVSTASGQAYRAGRVISTLPLGVMQELATDLFEPPLPKRQLQALGRATMGQFVKMWIQFAHPFWTSKGPQWLAAPGLPDDPMEFHDLDALEPGFGVLFTYVTGDHARAWEALDDAEAQAKLLDRLRRLFPGVALPEPTAYYMTRHGLDPLKRGAYSTFRTGFADAEFADMIAPVSCDDRTRVLFAGEHTCKAFTGFLHGAHFSGRDAASEVLSELGVEAAGAKLCDDLAHRSAIVI